MTKAIIASHPASLAYATEGDLVVTDFWTVARTARASGLQVRDLRDCLGGDYGAVDSTVDAWRREILEDLDRLEWRGVKLAPALGANLLWTTLFPMARHAFVAATLAAEGLDMIVDSPSGTPVGDAVLAVGRGAGARVEQIPSGSRPLLPPSHRPVELGEASSLQRYRAFRAASPFISLRSRIVRDRPRMLICVAWYPSLQATLDRLAANAAIALWPWALPPGRKSLELVASGGVCLDPSTPADAVDLEAAREHLEATMESADLTTPDFPSGELTESVAAHATERMSEDMRFVLYRSAAALNSLNANHPDAVVVPTDIGLVMSPLVQAAKRLGIPSILVQHGHEASSLTGDKLEADHVLVWSEAVAKRYAEDGRYAPPGRFTATGPAMLEAVQKRWQTADASTSRAKGVLYLSYAARHNLAAESWMSPEEWVGMVSRSVANLPRGVNARGLKLHPAESPEAYRRVMAAEGLAIPLLTDGLVADVLDGVGLVVGPESTGLAEAWGAGRSVICVNLAPTPMSPPFDGSTEVPVARDQYELDGLVAKWAEGQDLPGRPAPLFDQALGEIEGAIERTTEAILRIADGRREDVRLSPKGTA